MGWDELNAKYSAGAQSESTPNEWGSLGKKYTQQTGSISQRPEPVGDKYVRGAVSQMSTLDKMRAALGSGFADFGLAAKQIVGKATPADADAKRKMDAALLDMTPGGGALNVAGNTAPTLAVPVGAVGGTAARVAPFLTKAAPVIDGAAQGAIAGGMQPVGEGESRGFNMGAGAVGGSLLPGAAALRRGLAGSTSPEAAALAELAIKKYGIPLQASDLTDSKFLKTLNSLAGDMPVTGNIVKGRQAAKQTAFNSAVGKQFGAEGERMTPDVVSRAYDKLSQNFNDIYGRNPADAFELNDALNAVRARIAQEGTNDQQRIANGRLNELFSRVDPNTGKIDGKFFNNWQQDLRQAAGNDHLLNQLRKDALAGYNAGVTGADANLLNQTRAQYRNYKIVEPLLDKAAVGDVSPGLLAQRVAKETSDYARGGGGDLAELGRIGNQFMVDRVPQTGGSLRAGMQSMMIPSAGVGGAVGGIPGAAMGAALPPVVFAGANGLMNNNMVRNAMIKEALNGPAAARSFLEMGIDPKDMLSETLRRGLLQTAPAVGAAGLLSF